jgi:hypothetical protein
MFFSVLLAPLTSLIPHSPGVILPKRARNEVIPLGGAGPEGRASLPSITLIYTLLNNGDRSFGVHTGWLVVLRPIS